MSFLPVVDRALARNHRRQSRLRHLSGSSASVFSVSNPPPKALLIWDGECHFCRLWIERWQEITAGKVDYATYQEAAHQFSEIPAEQFKHAMALIEPDGKTFFAAEAVYRSLQYRPSRRWLAWSYNQFPGS